MKPDFKLRASLPKVMALNRPLLIGVAAVVSFFLLWFIVLAFKSPAQHNNKSGLTLGNTSAVGVSPILNELPKNYQDVNAIKKYTESDPIIPPAVTQELENLRAQESAMQAQLAQLQSHPASSSPSSSSLDGDTQSARKSDLFFSSAKPASSVFPDESKNSQNTNNNNILPSTAYTQQNMQGQKMNFMDSTDNQGDIYNHYSMVKPISPNEVQAGTIVAANLLTAINTSLPGDIIAQVRQDVYDTVSGQILLIPKGSKLLGKYDSSIAYGQERILIVFNRIIRPDGTSIQLSNFTAANQQGESGFDADVNNHWGKVLGAATISTMLSFGAGVAANNHPGGGGTNQYYPSSQQTAITGAAGNVSQTGQALTSRAMDIQPTLTVPVGFSFNIIVNKDMVLAPYAGKKL